MHQSICQVCVSKNNDTFQTVNDPLSISRSGLTDIYLKHFIADKGFLKSASYRLCFYLSRASVQPNAFVASENGYDFSCFFDDINNVS